MPTATPTHPVRVFAGPQRLQRTLGARFVLRRRPAIPDALAIGALVVQPVELGRVGRELGQGLLRPAGRATLPTVGVPGPPDLLDLLRRPSAPRRRMDPLMDPHARSANGGMPVQSAPVRHHQRPRHLATHAAFTSRPYAQNKLTHDPDP